MRLYENIKQFREQRGMTQEQLAKLTGYKDRTSIAKIEAGRIDLPQSKVVLFAKALGTTPTVLLGIDTHDSYYHDDEVAQMADMLHKNPRYRVLLDASKDLKESDVEFIVDMIESIKKRNGND